MTDIWPLPSIEFRRLPDIEDQRSVALVYSSPAWQAVGSQLSLDVVWSGEPLRAEESHWADLSESIDGDVIYALGGGLTVDAAKYMARRHQRPLVCLPTALSVDAFLTWASGIRRGGCVHYIETQLPERLIVDLDVIAAAPAGIRAAGICDVLSIATGCWDWRLAENRQQNPPTVRYVPYIEQIALGILRGAFDCAEAAGRGDREGLSQLLGCLVMEVQLCNQVGHSRPEEGSEHYFAYSVENVLGSGLPHGHLVGPGIVLIAALQGQNTEPLVRALSACNIPLDRISRDATLQTLRDLPAYARRHELPYGIAHELDRHDLNIPPELG